jgi:hypothetical protein
VKVIFLDIDGVMNSMRSMHRLYHAGHGRFNDIPVHETVGPLNKIIKHTDAKIVISSTWRKLHNSFSMAYILFLCGVKGEVIDSTPVIHNKQRGFEIKTWLEQRDDIEAFVVLDDDSDMDDVRDHFVKVNNKMGLTYKNAEEAIEILTR